MTSFFKKKLIWFMAVILILLLVTFLYFITNHYKNPTTNYGIFSERVDNASPNLIESFFGNVPEIAQIRLITWLAPLYHGMFSKEEAQRDWQVSLPIYKEIANDKNWSSVPSSLGNVYLSIIHFSGKQDEYYAYIPKHQNGDKLPVLLFLHGFGGNFISYIYKLSLLADKYHIAVLAPSYKSGVWDSNSVNFVNNVIKDANNKFNLDPHNYFLMGFSNGGLIIPEVYKSSSDNYKGVILLSTYLDKDTFSDPSFISSLNNKKLLVIEGSEDTRIGIDNNKNVIPNLKTNNVDITLKEFPSDHFVFFDFNNEIIQYIDQTFFAH